MKSKSVTPVALREIERDHAPKQFTTDLWPVGLVRQANACESGQIPSVGRWSGTEIRSRGLVVPFLPGKFTYQDAVHLLAAACRGISKTYHAAAMEVLGPQPHHGVDRRT